MSQLLQDKILLVIAYLGHCTQSALASSLVPLWCAFFHPRPTTSSHPSIATAAPAIVTVIAAASEEDYPRRRLDCQLDATATKDNTADPQQTHEEQAGRQAADTTEKHDSFSANLTQCQQERASFADECEQSQQQPGRLSAEPQWSAEEYDTLSADLRQAQERKIFADASWSHT